MLDVIGLVFTLFYCFLIFNASANGSLRLSTPNSSVDETVLPIAMTLSINHLVEEGGAGGAGGGGGAGAGLVLTLLHIQRSKKEFYELRVFRSSIKFEDEKGGGSFT